MSTADVVDKFQVTSATPLPGQPSFKLIGSVTLL